MTKNPTSVTGWMTEGWGMLVEPEIHYHEAPGALVNGTRVLKKKSVPGDGHFDGATGTVVGSLGPHKGAYCYWVRFDDHPRMLIGVHSTRVLVIGEEKRNEES